MRLFSGRRRGGSRTAQMHRTKQMPVIWANAPAEMINVGRACARPVGGSRTAHLAKKCKGFYAFYKIAHMFQNQHNTEIMPVPWPKCVGIFYNIPNGRFSRSKSLRR